MLGGALALGAVLYATTETIQLDSAKTVGLISYAEVQKHNTSEDCWVVIGDKVYDLTKVGSALFLSLLVLGLPSLQSPCVRASSP